MKNTKRFSLIEPLKSTEPQENTYKRVADRQIIPKCDFGKGIPVVMGNPGIKYPGLNLEIALTNYAE